MSGFGNLWTANVATATAAQIVNAVALAAIVINIRREQRPSLDRIEVTGSVKTSKIIRRVRRNPEKVHSSQQQSASDGSPVPPSSPTASLASSKPPAVEVRQVKYTSAYTISLNRILFASVLINVAAAIDPLGIRKIFTFKGWYFFIVLQLWLLFAAFCNYFFAWLQFLMNEAQIQPVCVRRLSSLIFISTQFLNSFVAGFFLIGLYSNADVCITSYSLWLCFFSIFPMIMLVTTLVASKKTITILRGTGQSDQQSKEIHEIRTKARYFVICCSLVVSGFLLSFVFRVWTGLCSDSSQLHRWYYFFSQVMLAVAYPFGILFNWIRIDPNSTSSSRPNV